MECREVPISFFSLSLTLTTDRHRHNLAGISQKCSVDLDCMSSTRSCSFYIYKESMACSFKKWKHDFFCSLVSMLVFLFLENMVSHGAQQLSLRHTVTKLWRRNWVLGKCSCYQLPESIFCFQLTTSWHYSRFYSTLFFPLFCFCILHDASCCSAR